MTPAALQLWPTMRRVERRAWHAIVRCTRIAKLGTLPLPIPVEQWVEGPLKIRLAIEELPELLLGVSRPREKSISINQSIVDNEPRYRFTLAHELGHILLHERVGGEFRSRPDREFVEDRLEREADRFAAAFLMPLPAVTHELSRLSQAQRMQPEGLLAQVRRGEAAAEQVMRAHVLPGFMRRFGVSRQAAAYRFRDFCVSTGEPALSFQAVTTLLTSPDIPF